MVDIKEEDGKSTTLLILETITALMTAAFGFVAALAWNSAILAVINQYFPAEGDPTGLLIYAVIVTIIAVIAIVLIGRAQANMKKRVIKK